jgi:hypothetical protein
VPRRANRRLTARTACQLGVRYRTTRSWHPATAMDLSRRGCRLRLGEDLPRGAEVAVALETAGKDCPSLSAEVAGKVIWSRLEGLSYQCGIHFAAEAAELDPILEAVR